MFFQTTKYCEKSTISYRYNHAMMDMMVYWYATGDPHLAVTSSLSRKHTAWLRDWDHTRFKRLGWESPNSLTTWGLAATDQNWAPQFHWTGQEYGEISVSMLTNVEFLSNHNIFLFQTSDPMGFGLETSIFRSDFPWFSTKKTHFFGPKNLSPDCQAEMQHPSWHRSRAS